MKEHYLGKIAIKILVRNKKTKRILITRETGDTKYEIPGGRLDLNESIEKSIKRELKEELGLDCKGLKFQYIYSEEFVHMRESVPHFMLTFLVDLTDAHVKSLQRSYEADKMVWVDKRSYKKYKYYVNLKNALDFYFSI